MPTPFDPTSSQSGTPLAAEASDAAVQVEKLTTSQQRFTTELAASSRESRAFGAALSKAFVGLAIQGKSFGDVVSGLALSLSRLALNAAFKPLENALGGVFQSLITGALAPGASAQLASTAPSLFTPTGNLAAPAAFPLASGGAAGPGLVAALPSNLAAGPGLGNAAAPVGAGPGVQVTLNVSTPDAESFRRSETQLAAMLSRAVSQGQRNL